MQTGPPRKCCQISQKIEGVEPHPMPQLHASLGCPNRPCGGRGHAATEKKPPPPAWPASDLKKGMTSACTSRGASVRGRGPFHRGPHPQESAWGSCQALSAVLMDSAPPPPGRRGGNSRTACGVARRVSWGPADGAVLWEAGPLRGSATPAGQIRSPGPPDAQEPPGSPYLRYAPGAFQGVIGEFAEHLSPNGSHVGLG